MSFLEGRGALAARLFEEGGSIAGTPVVRGRAGGRKGAGGRRPRRRQASTRGRPARRRSRRRPARHRQARKRSR